MKLKKAIKILKKHQQGRKPKKLAEAINVILYALPLYQRYFINKEIGDYNEIKKLGL